MNDVYHLLPINDKFEHTESMTCICSPDIQVFENGKFLAGFLVVHNSFDGRELCEKNNIRTN